MLRNTETWGKNGLCKILLCQFSEFHSDEISSHDSVPKFSKVGGFIKLPVLPLKVYNRLCLDPEHRSRIFKLKIRTKFQL